jgi:hypothetical protein
VRYDLNGFSWVDDATGWADNKMSGAGAWFEDRASDVKQGWKITANDPSQYLSATGDMLHPMTAVKAAGALTGYYEFEAMINSDSRSEAFNHGAMWALTVGSWFVGGEFATGSHSACGTKAGTAGTLLTRKSRYIESILKPGGHLIGEAGSSSRVRIIRGGKAEAEALFGELSEGGRLINKPNYPGTMVELRDGSLVGYRPRSTSGPPTIDVFSKDVGIKEVKFIEP